MRDFILTSLARCALSRPRTVLLVAGLLAVAGAAYAAFSLRMNANTDDLIDADRPYMQDYRAFLGEFGDLEPIICVVAAKPGIPGEDMKRAADYLIERLRGVDGLESVRGRISAVEQQRMAFRAMSLEELQGLALAAEGIGRLRSGHDVQALLEFASEQLERVPRTIVPSKQMERGAAGIFVLQAIASVVPRTLSEKDTEALIEPPLPRYLTSDTGRLTFIEIMPAKDYGTLAVIQKPLEAIRRVLAECREEFPGIECGLTGKPVLQADEMATTDRDMTRSSIIAIILVALLFMLVIGGIRRPLLAVVALLVAIAWTFGLTTLVVGQLNLLSIVFTLILVGIGIDFGVHVVARFKEEREKKPLPDALETTLMTAGRGNITGAVTSSLAFFMALFTDFRGLQELGFIGGAGLLLCLISMMLVLPALLVVFDRPRAKRDHSAPPAQAVLHATGRRPLLLSLAALTVVTALLAPGTRDLAFNGNVLELQATGLDSVEWEHRVLDDSAAATWFGAAVVETPADVRAIVDAAAAEKAIGNTVSIADFLPPSTEERERHLKTLRKRAAPSAAPPEAMWTGASLRRSIKAIERLEKLAGESDGDAAFRLRDLKKALARIARTVEDTRADGRLRKTVERRVKETGRTLDIMMSGLERSLREALPAAVRHRLVAPSGRFLVAMHPSRDVWDVAAMEEYVAAMKRVAPAVTGIPITHLYSIYDMQTGFGRAALYALAAVLVLVLLDFRSLSASMLAIIPLIVGAVWLAIAMSLLELDFNLANFFAVPILIGLSVDNGIHLVHRWRESREEATRFGSTQRGILLTSLTSMIGFGCLAFATHQGLMSLGLLMALGCATSLLAALVVLPAVLALFRR